MGQKVNPHGMRVGVIKSWIMYAAKKMRLYLHIQKNLTEQRLMHRILK